MVVDDLQTKRDKRRGHHEGTGYQRADGRWEWKVSLEDGSRKSFYAPTQRQAREKANAWLRELEDGLDPTAATLSVSEFLDRWIADVATQRVRASTLASYQGHIDHHIKPRIGRKKLRKLTVKDVEGMMTAIAAEQITLPDGTTRQKTANATINLVRATLRASLSSAVKWEYVRQNVAGLADPRPIRRQRVKPMEPEEVIRFLRLTTKDTLGMLYVVAVHTGLRQGELLALTWYNVDLDAGVLRVTHTVTAVDGKLARTAPKTEQSERALMLSTPAIEALREQRRRIHEWELAATSRWQENNLVFPSTLGTFLNGSNVTHRFQKQLELHQFPKHRFHDLRHLTASILLAEGMDLFAVKEILGHSQIALTANLYGHMTRKLSADAAARMGSALGGDDDS
jgi:integrase